MYFEGGLGTKGWIIDRNHSEYMSQIVAVNFVPEEIMPTFVRHIGHEPRGASIESLAYPFKRLTSIFKDKRVRLSIRFWSAWLLRSWKGS